MRSTTHPQKLSKNGKDDKAGKVYKSICWNGICLLKLPMDLTAIVTQGVVSFPPSPLSRHYWKGSNCNNKRHQDFPVSRRNPLPLPTCNRKKLLFWHKETTTPGWLNMLCTCDGLVACIKPAPSPLSAPCENLEFPVPCVLRQLHGSLNSSERHSETLLPQIKVYSEDYIGIYSRTFFLLRSWGEREGGHPFLKGDLISQDVMLFFPLVILWEFLKSFSEFH